MEAEQEVNSIIAQILSRSGLLDQVISIKLKARITTMPLTSSHQSPYTCLHRCQKNCTKNLVPLAEAKFIFERIQGTMPNTFLYSNLALNSSSFADFSTIFNGNVFTIAKAVVCPLDAEDVSK